jgi:hypothetical protein
MNPQTLSLTLFPILFGMVIAWFVLIKLLFNRLERAHPQKYEAMGRPSLFLRNSISGGWATLKFLATREHKALNDKYLSKLSDAMLAFFGIYLLLFVALFVLVALQTPAA